MSALPKTFLSAHDYLLLDESSDIRHEYINGEALAMTGASIEHNQIVTNCVRALGNAVDANGCDIYVNDIRVSIEPTGAYVYPDVVIVCGDKQVEDRRGDTLLNPTIIIEILSASTEAYDRGLKWAHYKRIPSLQEYLLVDQTRPYVEQYTRQEADVWQYVTYEGLDTTIIFPSIGADMTLAALYRKVMFGE